MINLPGQKRVIITNVEPSLSDIRFPVKVTSGEAFTISASVFCDGHDEVSASLLFAGADQAPWEEFSMVFVSNDCWQFKLTVPQPGRYRFSICAWVDHFKTWKKGLIKKQAAGQDLAIEYQIGAGLLRKQAELIAGDTQFEADHSRLVELAGLLEKGGNPALDLALGEEPGRLMAAYRNPALVTQTARDYLVEASRVRAKFSTWYELFPRSASAEPGRHGTFRDVIRLLPRIRKMGFDVLYFPPIHPIGEHKRKGKNNSLTASDKDPGSPWAIGSRHGGHKAIHPELGRLEDFQLLVAEAKNQGIEIALDIAFQCAPDHPYVKEHPAWFTWRPDGTVQYAENPPKKYEDILPFNFESEDWENLWEELRSVLLYWVGQGIEIFRIDNPHTKSFLFWEWVIAEVRKVNANVIFLAEAFTRPRLMERLAKAGFDQSYTYFSWRTTSAEIREYLTELTQTELKHYFRPNFWPNTPDILPKELVEGGEAAHLVRLVLAGTLSSNYGIYGPVYEFGINEPVKGKEEYTDNEKYELKTWDWQAKTRTSEYISLLNRIRRQCAALQQTERLWFCESDNPQILAWCKESSDGSNKVIVVVNLDVSQVQSAWITLPVNDLKIAYDLPVRVRDLLSGSTWSWNEKNWVQLDPSLAPAHILLIEGLPASPLAAQPNT